MSFSIKLNKSNNFSFRLNPSSSSIAFILTLPRITLSLRVKRRKKPISKPHDIATSYKPVTSIDIRSLQTKKYKPYINKISRLIRLNRLSNFLIPSLLLSLLPKLISELLDTKTTIYTIVITLFFLLIGVLGIFLKIYLHSSAGLQYDLLNDYNEVPSIWAKLVNSDMLCQVVGVYELDDNATKKNAGLSTIYDRIQVELKYKTPYYIRTKAKVLELRLDDYTIVILPKHYIIVDKYELAIIDTEDLIISSETIQYAETESLPTDASVLNRRWRYANKDGSKDKRYKKNEQIPICNYKLISIEDGSVFNLLFLSSLV